nr:MAG TPA: hypothetical protein [Caudoviricetes sp.]
MRFTRIFFRFLSCSRINFCPQKSQTANFRNYLIIMDFI